MTEHDIEELPQLTAVQALALSKVVESAVLDEKPTSKPARKTTPKKDVVEYIPYEDVNKLLGKALDKPPPDGAYSQAVALDQETVNYCRERIVAMMWRVALLVFAPLQNLDMDTNSGEKGFSYNYIETIDSLRNEKRISWSAQTPEKQAGRRGPICFYVLATILGLPETHRRRFKKNYIRRATGWDATIGDQLEGTLTTLWRYGFLGKVISSSKKDSVSETTSWFLDFAGFHNVLQAWLSRSEQKSVKISQSVIDADTSSGDKKFMNQCQRKTCKWPHTVEKVKEFVSVEMQADVRDAALVLIPLKRQKMEDLGIREYLKTFVADCDTNLKAYTPVDPPEGVTEQRIGNRHMTKARDHYVDKVQEKFGEAEAAAVKEVVEKHLHMNCLNPECSPCSFDDTHTFCVAHGRLVVSRTSPLATRPTCGVRGESLVLGIANTEFMYRAAFAAGNYRSKQADNTDNFVTNGFPQEDDALEIEGILTRFLDEHIKDFNTLITEKLPAKAEDTLRQIEIR